MVGSEHRKDSRKGINRRLRGEIREAKGNQESVDFVLPRSLNVKKELLEKKPENKQTGKLKKEAMDVIKAEPRMSDEEVEKTVEDIARIAFKAGDAFNRKDKISSVPEKTNKFQSLGAGAKKSEEGKRDPVPFGKSLSEKEFVKSKKGSSMLKRSNPENKITERDFERKIKSLGFKFGVELFDQDGNSLIIKSFNKAQEVTVEKTINGKKNAPEKVSLDELKKLLNIHKERKSPVIKENVPSPAPKAADKKEKAPPTPEIMEAKLDELKKMLLSKKTKLKECEGKKGKKGKIKELENEIKEITGEIDETGKYFDVSRKASEKIIDKIRNRSKDVNGNLVHGYEDINAKTREEGDEKFLKKARQLWTDFVTHGTIVWDNNKKEYILDAKGGDLDSKSCEALLKKAGLSLDYLERVAPGESVKGKTMLDTSNVEGVVYDKENGSLYIDHHGENSPNNISTAARTYELLVKMGFLKEDETMEKVIKYINEADNAIDVDVDSYYKNSWRTIRGLSRFIKFNELYDFFRSDNPDPERELSDRELVKYGLKDRSKEQYSRAINLHKELENLTKEGFILNLDKYGKVVVDIGGKVRKDFEAVRAYGANTYIVWNPERGDFWMTSENEITDKFSQGKNLRKTMWITEKRVGKPEPMKMTLEEVLQIMTGKEKLEEILKEKSDDGKLTHEKLIDFFEKESGGRKIRGTEGKETGKIEELKQEVEKRRKEYLEFEYKKKNSLKRVWDYFNSLKRDKEKEGKNFERDKEVAEYRAYYDDALMQYKSALIEDAKFRNASDKELLDIAKIFQVEANTNIADGNFQVKIENQEGRFSGFIKNHSMELVERYKKLPLSKKIAIGAAFGIAALSAGYAGAAVAGFVGSAAMARRMFIGVVTGTTVSLAFEARGKKKTEENMQKEMKDLEKNIKRLSEEEKIKLIIEHINRDIKDEDNKINKIKNANFRHMGYGIMAGTIVGSGALSYGFHKIAGMLGLGHHEIPVHGKTPSNLNNVMGTNVPEENLRELQVIGKGSSVERTLIDHFKGSGMSAEEAGGKAHLMAQEYAHNHGLKDGSLVHEKAWIKLDSSGEKIVDINDSKGFGDLPEYRPSEIPPIENADKTLEVANSAPPLPESSGVDNIHNAIRTSINHVSGGNIHYWKEIKNMTFSEARHNPRINMEARRHLIDYHRRLVDSFGRSAYPRRDEQIFKWIGRTSRMAMGRRF